MGLCVRRVFWIGCAVASASVVGALGLGPLDPPAGPVASTPGPEPRTAINSTNTPGDAASLFRITAPGSYYLAGNITGVTGKNGIVIAASDVTLDLNGFRLLGVAGSLAGIATTSGQSDVAIRNGVVRAWGGGGISASTTSACIVEGVRAIGNTGNGIQLGPDSMVRGCYASSNTQGGINTSANAEVTDCLMRLNGQTGVTTGDHSTVSGCVTANNTGNGMTVGAGALVSRSITAQNAVGVSASSGLNAVDCIARDNNSHGFTVFGASFTNCESTVNTGDGFSTDTALLTGCRTTGNGGAGVTGGNNTLVTHSLTAANTLFGLHLGTGYALQNLCTGDCAGNSGELREIKFDTRGRGDSNHLMSFNAQLWGLGGPSAALFIKNSLNGGFVTTFGGTEGPDIGSSNITSDLGSGNYDLP